MRRLCPAWSPGGREEMRVRVGAEEQGSIGYRKYYQISSVIYISLSLSLVVLVSVGYVKFFFSYYSLD
jgi:hypothetical protein